MMQKYLCLYFSGTGNTRFVARAFSRRMAATCHSIEEDIDFAGQIAAHDVIAVCYPIYGSRAPLIMRQFVVDNMAAFAGKKLIIFVTQTFFSGDGARSLVDLFPVNHVEIIYAEHFFMPNNVSNIFFLRQAGEKSIVRRARAAARKMDRVCHDIRSGKVKRRGFSTLAKLIGKAQGIPWQGSSRHAAASKGTMEHRAKSSVKIGADCNACGICVACCPMDNFTSEDSTVTPKNHCTVCYRCINRCPHKAISVWFTGRPMWQYKGVPRRAPHKER